MTYETAGAGYQDPRHCSFISIFEYCITYLVADAGERPAAKNLLFKPIAIATLLPAASTGYGPRTDYFGGTFG